MLQILDRLAPLHPHIMGDAICAWFGKKNRGKNGCVNERQPDDDDDDEDDNQIGVGEGRQKR